MGDVKMIEVGGVMGADADASVNRGNLRRMFAMDPKGTLGWLRAPFQEAAAVFRFDAAQDAWALRNHAITFLSAGEGDPGDDVGFQGVQADDATSLLRDGFPTSDAHFAVQGMALQMSALGYTPATTEESAGMLLVNRNGAGRADVLRLAPVFADTFFRGMVAEFYQNSRRCFAVLGKAQTFAAEELGDASGFHGATPVPFKRALVIPPSSSGCPEYNIRLRTSREVSVPRDRDFPAPEDGAVVVFTVHMELAGYCANGTGHPIVTTSDNAEAIQAHMFIGFLPKAS